jgi:hypothetical protein
MRFLLARVDMMKLLGIALMLSTSFTVLALNESFLGSAIDAGHGDQEASAVHAVKFDEYETNGASIGDMKARLDGFFFELKKDETSRAYVLIYGSKGAKPRYRSEAIKSYLELRGLSSARLKIIRGGNRTEPMLEFWIVPVGAEPPNPSPTYHPTRNRKR